MLPLILKFQLDKQFVWCCQQNRVTCFGIIASNLYTGSHTRSTSSRGSWSWRLVERLVKKLKAESVQWSRINFHHPFPRILCARINECLHWRRTLDMQHVWTCYLSQCIKYQEGKHQQSMPNLQSRLISALPNYDLQLGWNIVKLSPHHPLSDPISHANLQRKRKLQVVDCVICSFRGWFEHLEKQQRKVHQMNLYEHKWIHDSNGIKWLYQYEQRPKPLASRVQDVQERVLPSCVWLPLLEMSMATWGINVLFWLFFIVDGGRSYDCIYVYMYVYILIHNYSTCI